MSDLPPALKELARIYAAILEQRLLAQLREKWLAAGGELPTPAPSEPLDIHQEFQQIRDEHARIKRSLASDTPACDQTPPPGSAPRSK